MLEHKGTEAVDADEPAYDYLVGHLTAGERLDGLTVAVAKLQRDFGRWQTAWGEINRYQRLTDDIVQPFDDSKPSLPVGFASATWGALASFDFTNPRKTMKIYGSVGNSFVAAVEFGPTIHAKAIMSGGESGDPRVGSFHRPSAHVHPGKIPRRVIQPRRRDGPRRAQLSSVNFRGRGSLAGIAPRRRRRPLSHPVALFGTHLTPLPAQLRALFRRHLAKAIEGLAHPLLLFGRQAPVLLPALPELLALLRRHGAPLRKALLGTRALFRRHRQPALTALCQRLLTIGRQGIPLALITLQ